MYGERRYGRGDGAAATGAAWRNTEATRHMHSRGMRRDDDSDDDGGGDSGAYARRRRYDAQHSRSGGGDADEPFDYKRDRKLRRRADKLAKKEQRMAAHSRWVEQRRAARAQLLARAQQKRERRRDVVLQPAPQQDVSRTTSRRRRADDDDEATVARARRPRKRVAAREQPRLQQHERRSDEAYAAAKSQRRQDGDGEVAATSAGNTAVATTVVVPRDVALRVRRCVNKLSVSNVVVLTRELSELVGSSTSSSEKQTTAGVRSVVSRAMVMTAVVQCVDALCTVDAGVLTHAGTLPLAALLRGLQLLHGAQVAAELLEQLCAALDAHLTAAHESAADNVASVLAHWYLLCGLDATFALSLLQMLLSRASLCSSRSGAPHYDVAAASCALALLRGCGAKLMKEAAAGVDAALRDARERLARAHDVTAATPRNNSDDNSNSNDSTASTAAAVHTAIEGVVRRDARELAATASLPRLRALVGVMGEIVVGHTRSARRSTTEAEVPITTMLNELCALLPGGGGADGGVSEQQRRTLRRVVQTASMLCGLTWSFVRAPSKPPRWHDPVARLQASSSTHSTHGSSNDDDNDDDDHGAAEQRMSTRATSTSGNANSAKGNKDDDDNDDDEEAAAAALKRQQIHAMRQEARALAGQRLTSESKRAIFQCVTSACDDHECYTLLMQRDPTCAHLPDVCAVLLQCCYQESHYNDYYTAVLQRFCHARRAHVKTLQFALWDRFKAVRVAAVDVTGYLNLSCLIASLVEHGTFTLSLLRGLDLDDTNKAMSLFARVLLLRLLLQLPAARLTAVFFGGDGVHAHDVQTNTADCRRCLATFLSHYFVDEVVASRWLPLFYDVVASGTPFALTNTSSGADDGDAYDRMLRLFMKRVRVAYKALRHGIE